MGRRKKEWLAFGATVLVLVLALVLLTALLTPKQHDFGSTWGHYLAEEPDSVDVMFFGSSLVYCDVIPGTLWEKTGLTGYVMAGPEQTMPMTWHYVRQALQTQSPQVIFVEITGVFYDRYTGFTKTNIGQMPWGRPRWQATWQEAEPEYRSGLLFPLIFYHDRWSDLTVDDLSVTLTGYDRDLLAGYTPLTAYCQTNGLYDRPMELDRENVARNVDYLEKIHTLCMERGITPVFYVAPTLGRVDAAEMEALQAQIRTWEGALLLDCNACFDAIGADEGRDFYDTLHYNTAGAVKFTAFLADWILEQELAAPSADQDLALWQSRADHIRQVLTQPMTPRT